MLTNSDTEVLVELIAKYGFRKAIELIDGMFAIAAFDSVNKRLYLARDRMGEKPLYYGQQGSTFYFSSELRAITKYKDFVKVINLCVFWINCLYDEIKWKYRYKINDKPRFNVLRGNYFDVVNNFFIFVFVGGDEVHNDV